MIKIIEHDKETGQCTIEDLIDNYGAIIKNIKKTSWLEKDAVIIINAQSLNEMIQKIGYYEDDKEKTVISDLLRLQRMLDECICANNNNEKVKKWNKELAFNVEFGEFMNEIPTTFKHWKKTALDNREKALEEYVDMLHFLLSWANDVILDYDEDIDSVNDWISSYDEIYNKVESCGINQTMSNGEKILKAYNHIITEGFCSEDIEEVFFELFMIGSIVGFSWNEICSAYIKKNKENYERQQRGY